MNDLLNRVDVLGVQVDRVSMNEALSIIEKYIEKRHPQLIVTANAEMVMSAQRNAVFRDIMNKAGLVLPDGAGVVWASRVYGTPVPERVAGYDTVQKLLALSANKGYKIFCLGASPGIAAAAIDEAKKKYPELQCVGVQDGYFDNAIEAELISKIAAVKPDILLCALGSPRQEEWIFANMATLNVPVSIGVGGTFDVMAGKVKRAPLWMQKAGLEWLFRLAQQPKRFFRMLALPHFVLRVYLSAWTRHS